MDINDAYKFNFLLDNVIAAHNSFCTLSLAVLSMMVKKASFKIAFVIILLAGSSGFLHGTQSRELEEEGDVKPKTITLQQQQQENDRGCNGGECPDHPDPPKISRQWAIECSNNSECINRCSTKCKQIYCDRTGRCQCGLSMQLVLPCDPPMFDKFHLENLNLHV